MTAKTRATAAPTRPTLWRRHALAQGVSLMLACSTGVPASAQITPPLVLPKGSNTTNRDVVHPDVGAAGNYPGQAKKGADAFGFDIKTGHGNPGKPGDAAADGGPGAMGTAAVSGSDFSLINAGPGGQLIGGAGGDGGIGGTGGRGGNGAPGAKDSQGGCPAIYKSCPYGSPGDGGTGGNGGAGGTGGAGVSGYRFTLLNTGLIQGGRGGDSGRFGYGGDPGSIPSGTNATSGADGLDGHFGDGGAGIVATGYSTIINSGLIAGYAGLQNFDGTKSADGHAIDLSGGANRLVLKSTDYMSSVAGLVVSTSGRLNGGDTLELSFADDAQFSLGRLQSNFLGFANLAKSGTAVLVLNTQNTTGSGATFTGNTTINEGQLNLQSGVTLAGTRGSAGVAGGNAIWASSGDAVFGPTGSWGYTPQGKNSSLLNNGSVLGGQGGDGNVSVSVLGASTVLATNGGVAVMGVDFQLTNTATGVIRGGNGGNAGLAKAGPTPAGAGGVAVLVGDGTTIINYGTIAGGVSGMGFGGGKQANAIEMGGNGSTLSLRPTSFIDGLVVSKGDNTLDLGGLDAGSFNAGLIGTQYLGFTRFTKTGSANWTLTGSGSQDWVVRNGTLTGNTSSMRGNLSFDPPPKATAAVVFDQATAGTYAGTITGDGNIAISGGGTLTFTQANSHTGRTHVIAGRLVLSGAGSFGAGILQVAQGAVADMSGISAASSTVGGLMSMGTLVLGNKNLQVDSSNGDSSFAGTITGTGGLAKVGSGTLTVTTAQSYSGGTKVLGGTLAINADSALGTVNSPLTLDGGSLQTQTSFVSTRPTTVGAAGGSIDTNARTTLTLANVISGPGALTKVGDGALVLSAANTFAGGVQVNAGALSISSDANLGAPPTGSFAPDGTLTFTGGGLGLDGGTLRVTSDVVSLRTLTLGLDRPSTIQVYRDTSLTLVTTINGANTLTKTGAGQLVLMGLNNDMPGHLGGLVVKDGSVSASNDHALGFFLGLNLDGGSLVTTANIATTRWLTLGAAGGSVNPVAATTLQFDGPVVGSGRLTKDGAGTLILSGNRNSYQGDTVVKGGTLRLLPGAQFGEPGHLLDLQNGRVELAGQASATLGQAQVASPGVLSIGEAKPGPAGKLEVLDALSNAGQITIQNALLTVGGTFINTGSLIVNAGGSVQVASFMQSAGTTTLAGGVMASAQALRLQGGTLRGSGTLDAAVQQSGGRVEVGAEGLDLSDAFTQDGGTLDFGLAWAPGGYQYGSLSAPHITLKGTLEFTLQDASAADLAQLESALLSNALHPLVSGDTQASFSSIRLDSTRAGVADLLLNTSEVAQVSHAFSSAVVAVPEPAHWAMLLAGLGIVAIRTRRSRV